MTTDNYQALADSEGVTVQLEQKMHELFTGVRIDTIETIRSSIQPNVTHVVVTDSDGYSGVGETFYGASTVEAHIHDVIVPTISSERPSASPYEMRRIVQGYVGYAGSGSEVRARSAIDMALWDIAAQRSEQPLSMFINGSARTEIRTYNTCSGTLYVNKESRQSSSNWGIGEGRPVGPYEDLWRFMNEPGRLARDLLDSGFSGMKVWPFDLAAEDSQGGAQGDFSFGLKVLDEIRSEVGTSMDLYLELHSLWSAEAIERLLPHLEEFNLAWVEDPIRADKVSELGRIRNLASMPIAVGENLGAGAHGYSSLIDQQATDVIILDVGWCGGITEALAFQEKANQAGLEVAYHDCTGPVSLAVAAHMAVASMATTVQEVARAFAFTWYQEMAEGLPVIDGEYLRVSGKPGHGAVLSQEFRQGKHVSSRVSGI